MDDSNTNVLKLTLSNSIISFLVNSLLIVLNSIEIQILRRKANKHLYEKILLSLTTCDLVIGIIGFLSSIIANAMNSKYATILNMNIWLYGSFYLQATSMLHLIIISLDRLWAVKAPLHHRIHVSGKKVTTAIALPWVIPTILILVNIALNIVQRMTAEEIYSYLVTTMCSMAAKVVLLADIVFLSSYGAITWTMIRNKRKAPHATNASQKTFAKTVALCFGITLVFILFTTPFVIVYLTIWDRPRWARRLCTSLMNLNPVFNSLVYLIQTYRVRKLNTVVRDSRNELVTSENTRL